MGGVCSIIAVKPSGTSIGSFSVFDGIVVHACGSPAKIAVAEIRPVSYTAGMSSLARVLAAGIALFITGCGGDGGDPYAGADPRCAATCRITEPSLAGAYDICSTASARSCVDQCEVRIAGVATVCASCLLEGSDFGTGGGVGPADDCSNGTCTVTGRAGTCTYPEGNTAARDNCIRQVYPRREVACTVDFRPVAECATACA